MDIGDHASPLLEPAATDWCIKIRGGPTVTITTETTGDTTTVTASTGATGGTPVRLFLRAGVSRFGT